MEDPKHSKDDFINFVKDIEIAFVQLIESNFSISLPPERIPMEKLELTYEYNFGWNIDDTQDGSGKKIQQLFCFIGSQITGKLMPESAPVAKLIGDGIALSGDCKFVVRYILKHKNKPAKELLDRFTEGNALPHAIPYIRMYFDSQFGQMGLPRIMIPLLKKVNVNPVDEAAKLVAKNE